MNCFRSRTFGQAAICSKTAPVAHWRRGLATRLRGCLVLLLASSLALAQTVVESHSSHSIPSGPLQLRTLYRHFLALQTQLDRASNAPDKQGKDSEGLRDHYQRELGFTSAQFAAVRHAGVRLEAELKAQDAKAKKLIDAFRAALPPSVTSAADLPPVPPELVELQKERESMIDREIERLNAALGPEAAAKLESYLRGNFSSHVSLQTLPPLPPPGRLQRLSSKSSTGVQR